MNPRALLCCLAILVPGAYSDGEEGLIETEAKDQVQHVFLDHHEHLIRTRRQAGRQPIRISHFLDSSITSGSTLTQAKRDYIMRLIQDAITYFQTTIRVDRLQSNIRLKRSCQNSTFWEDLSNLTNRACVNSCSTTTKCGTATVPENHLFSCVSCPQISGNRRGPCTDQGNAGPGVAADLVVYVAAVNTNSCSTPDVNQVASAAVCAQEGGMDRPVAGYINLCPGALRENNPTLYNVQLSTVKHELIHVLAFAPQLYAFYRDENSNPRTQRKSNGWEPNLGMVTRTLIPDLTYTSQVYRWSTSTIAVENRQWKTLTGNILRSFYMMVTPKVQEVVRNHFNCPSLSGAELENQNGVATALTHWEKRVFENEAMCGVYTQNPVISNITLALLEDSGWYDVDYSKAETLLWGRNLGCDFARESCLAWMEKKIASSSPVTPFCRSLPTSEPRFFCNLDRTARAICNLKRYPVPLESVYQYMTSTVVASLDNRNHYGGLVNTADYCPFKMQFLLSGTDKRSVCAFSQNAPSSSENVALEFYGGGSKCVQHGERWSFGEASQPGNYGSGCYKFYCGASKQLVIDVGLARVNCTNQAGKTARISQMVAGQQSRGSIICPSYEEMCEVNGVFSSPPASTSIPCPNNINCNAASAMPNVNIIFVSSSGSEGSVTWSKLSLLSLAIFQTIALLMF